MLRPILDVAWSTRAEGQKRTDQESDLPSLCCFRFLFLFPSFSSLRDLEEIKRQAYEDAVAIDALVKGQGQSKPAGH
jgi:hypothetical protein